MRVSELGEFALIELLAGELGMPYPAPAQPVRRGLLVDVGDDALVTRRRDAALIWTTDTMVADVHFLPGRTAWPNVGWKALAANVSDIAAMGGRPDLALVTLALPGDFCVEDAQALYRGLREATEAFGVMVGGGDIVRAPVFSITIALAGIAAASELREPLVMTRSAARPGDLVAVSGSLGDSAAGLRLLLNNDAFASDAARRLRGAHERPQPRVALAGEAVRAGVRCAIDVSDGLVQDLGHIARASGVAIRVDVTRLPLSPELIECFPAQAAGLALGGGEDYELVLCAPAVVIESLLGRMEAPLTVIGEVVRHDEPHVAVVDETGRQIPLPRGGWDHFGGAS
jgi:thiamine-monophosphate kinase